MDEQRRAVRRGDEPEREEVVRPDRLAVVPTQVDDQLPDQESEPCPDRESAGHRPDEVHHDPAEAVPAEVVKAEQAEAEHDERERGAVVQPGLAGEREPQPVAVPRVGELHIGGEDGVGGRECGAEQDRGTGRQPEPVHADERHEPDGDEHRQACEADR